MKKPVKIILIGEADATYKRLNYIAGQQQMEGKMNSDEIQLLKSINQKISFIKDNPFYGDIIKKSLIPDEYKNNYNAVNLFRVELSGFWRMLYTVRGDQIDIICFILDISNHEDYNKLLGYRKR